MKPNLFEMKLVGLWSGFIFLQFHYSSIGASIVGESTGRGYDDPCWDDDDCNGILGLHCSTTKKCHCEDHDLEWTRFSNGYKCDSPCEDETDCLGSEICTRINGRYVCRKRVQSVRNEYPYTSTTSTTSTTPSSHLSHWSGTTTPSSNNDNGDGSSLGPIIGGVVIVILIGTIIVIIVYVRKRRANMSQAKPSASANEAGDIDGSAAQDAEKMLPDTNASICETELSTFSALNSSPRVVLSQDSVPNEKVDTEPEFVDITPTEVKPKLTFSQVAERERMKQKCRTCKVTYGPMLICIADIIEKDIKCLTRWNRVTLQILSSSEQLIAARKIETAHHDAIVYTLEAWVSSKGEEATLQNLIDVFERLNFINVKDELTKNVEKIINSASVI